MAIQMEFVLPPWSPKGWPFRWGRPFRCVANQMGVGVGIYNSAKAYKCKSAKHKGMEAAKGLKCRRARG